MGGEVGVEDEQLGVFPIQLAPVVAKGDDLLVLVGLEQVGVGVEDVVGAGLAGLLDQGGEIEGEQFGDGEEGAGGFVRNRWGKRSKSIF